MAQLCVAVYQSSVWQFPNRRKRRRSGDLPLRRASTVLWPHAVLDRRCHGPGIRPLTGARLPASEGTVVTEAGGLPGVLILGIAGTLLSRTGRATGGIGNGHPPARGGWRAAAA